MTLILSNIKNPRVLHFCAILTLPGTRWTRPFPMKGSLSSCFTGGGGGLTQHPAAWGLNHRLPQSVLESCWFKVGLSGPHRQRVRRLRPGWGALVEWQGSHTEQEAREGLHGIHPEPPVGPLGPTCGVGCWTSCCVSPWSGPATSSWIAITTKTVRQGHRNG